MNAVFLTVGVAAVLATLACLERFIHYWSLAAQHRAPGQTAADVWFSPTKGDPERYPPVGRQYLQRAKVCGYAMLPLAALASISFRLAGIH